MQADGEHLPFADDSFDLTYCVAALHHALDLSRMVGEMARVTRRGGMVCALNEGTRAVGASGENEDQSEEKELGINEHVHSLYAYLWALLAGRALGAPRRARGGRRRPARAADRRQAAAGPRSRPVGGDVVRADLLRLLGREPVLDEGQVSFSVNVMTRGPGERVAAMLSLFRGIADEILVALDDRAGPEVEGPLAAVADRVIRYPYADPVDRPLAWLHAECRGDWVLTIDDDEVPMQALLDALPALAQAERRDALLAPAPLALRRASTAGSTRGPGGRTTSRGSSSTTGACSPSRPRPTSPSRCSDPRATSTPASTTSTRSSTRARLGRRRRGATNARTPGSASRGGR